MRAEKPLAGKIALVTGASRGVGKGCALELGAAGATVYLTGRTVTEGSAPLPGSIGGAAEEVSALGGRGIAIQCDHRLDDETAAVFSRIQSDEGRLDILVNNAFMISRELTSGLPFWETPASNWDDMIDVGVRSAYIASRLAARMMVPARTGLIANISSSGAREYAWHVVYGVGKAALDKITSDTAHELREHRVAVVSLWPGLVRTERIASVGKIMKDLDLSGSESQRFTGRAIVALASDPNILDKSGRAISSRALADEYGFTDLDGDLPDGPMKERPAGVAGSQP